MQHKEMGYEHLSDSPNRTKGSGKANGTPRLNFVTSLNIARSTVLYSSAEFIITYVVWETLQRTRDARKA